MRSPAFTLWPSVTLISNIVPGIGAVISSPVTDPEGALGAGASLGEGAA